MWLVGWCFTSLLWLRCKSAPINTTVKHVLVIGIDGFGGMYMENATSFLPNINQLIEQGSYTFRARDVYPAISAPNWAALLTGMTPPQSGIVSNSWVPADDNPPNATVQEMPPISGAGNIPQTMWNVAKSQTNNNIITASSVSWDWISYLCAADVDHTFQGSENDTAVQLAMSNFIIKFKPNLMFTHFDQVDEAGHSTYWGSEAYYNAAKNVDGLIGLLLKSLEQAEILNQTQIFISADHGGYGNTHGSFSQCNMYIPVIASGPGIVQNKELTNYVEGVDLAPTILNSLGLKQGQFMEGHVIEQIYS